MIFRKKYRKPVIFIFIIQQGLHPCYTKSGINPPIRGTRMDKTIRRYQQDPYLKTCHSTVISVITDRDEIAALGGVKEESTACLVLDQTLFFPEGGGQPSDLGQIRSQEDTFDLIYVFEKDGIVYHQGRLREETRVAAGLNRLSAMEGTQVECLLDWDRRFDHMQRHCGEHILSAVFYERYGGVNRGFHMGADYMTIDINLEENPDFSQLTEEMIQAVEWEANRMVWSDLPVTTRFFGHRSQAEGLPMRKPLTIENDIVLVCVGDESKASGCVACCGTHPHRTGEVGLIKIYRFESYKGMFRITFDAGAGALKNCRSESRLVKDLCRQYSSDAATLPDKMQQREQKNGLIRQELYDLKQEYLAEKAREIGSDLETSSTVYMKKFDVLKIDDLLALSKLLPPLAGKLVSLISIKENTLILLSGGRPDCNKIIKDNAPVWRGKGGGRADSARAMFPGSEDLDCFLEFLRKAY